MTVQWVHTDREDAIAALDAVADALEGRGGGAEAAQGALDPALREMLRDDPYLAQNITVAHERWAIDQGAIVASHRPGVGRLVNGFQRLVRRATWWYAAPQWESVNVFHAAVVRSLATLVKDDHVLRDKVRRLDDANALGRLGAAELAVQQLQHEVRLLQRALAERDART